MNTANKIVNTERDKTPILLSPRHGKCQGYQALGQRMFDLPTEDKSISGNANKSMNSAKSEKELMFADRVDRAGR